MHLRSAVTAGRHCCRAAAAAASRRQLATPRARWFGSGSSQVLVNRFYKQAGVEYAEDVDGESGYTASRSRIRHPALARAQPRVSYEPQNIAPLFSLLTSLLRSRSKNQVVLDGRPIKTPLRKVLLLPTEATAFVVALEWESQASQIAPHLMPATRIAMSAVDQMPVLREKTVGQIMRFLETDTVCFREEPEKYTTSNVLTTKQEETWDPIIEWFSKEFEIEPLETTYYFHVTHPEETTAALRKHIESLDDWELAAFDAAASSLKSFVLAAALLKYRVSPADALSASRLEETHQQDEWGYEKGADAHEGTEANLAMQIGATSTFVKALKCTV